MFNWFEAIITILIFILMCLRKIIVHFNVFGFNLINLTFIFTGLFIVKVVNLVFVCVGKISFSAIGKSESSRHFKTSFCDLSILYQRNMIKSNPTKGGNYVLLAMAISK